MNWKTETFDEWNKRKRRYNKWFAWYPVFSEEDGKTYWLETVYRQMYDYSSYTGTVNYRYKKIN